MCYFQFVKQLAMPGTPLKSGEGLIRSEQLLRELRSDLVFGYETVEANHGSQYLRRSLGRAARCWPTGDWTVDNGSS